MAHASVVRLQVTRSDTRPTSARPIFDRLFHQYLQQRVRRAYRYGSEVKTKTVQSRITSSRSLSATKRKVLEPRSPSRPCLCSVEETTTMYSVL